MVCTRFSRSSIDFIKDCLQSLAFPEMDFRRNEIKDVTDGTCAWLVKHEKYTTWLGQHRGLLWIKGKPGAGKSTLLKYALREANKRASRNKLVIASFFFHGRGASIQKSPRGMFRSLLHQILDQIPEFLSDFTSNFKKRCGVEGKLGDKWEWHLMELQKFFQDSIAHAKKPHLIQIYVDALDECGEETAIDLVADFERLVSKPPSVAGTALNLCFSCRHYPIVALNCGLTICVQDENDQDVRTYVRAQLERGISESSKAQELETEIAAKALGVFQWVFLVVPVVIRLHREGRNMNLIRKRLQETPSELSSLYEKLLEDISSDDQPRSLLLMQWIFFAFEPLSLTELRFAMAVGAATPYSLLSKMQKDSMEYVETDDEMEKMVQSLYRRLAEVKEHRGKRIAQFNHQSVNDYLLQSGLRKLDSSSEHSVTGRAHFRLSRSCIRYLIMGEVLHRNMQYQPKLKRMFPFLDYSIRNWVHHVEIVEKESIAQNDLLQLCSWPSNSIMKCLIMTYKEGGLYFYWNTGMTLLHVASASGLASAVAAIFYSKSNVEADYKDLLGRTPLLWAAERGHETIVKLLLERDDVKADSEDRFGQTPLSKAAERGHETIVKLLERDDIKVNSEDQFGRTPLSKAAE